MTTSNPKEQGPLRSIPFVRDAVVALITGAAVVLGQQVARGPNQLTAEAAYIEQLQIRVSELENRLSDLSAINTTQQIELAALRASLDSELNFQDLLCSILEAQPGLNWAKVVSEDVNGLPAFTMACLDTEYRATFAVEPFQYVGQTDYDIWDEATADQFYANDLQVYTTRAALTTYETWEHRTSGDLVQGRLTKFYFTYGGSEYIIGHFPGDQIPVTNFSGRSPGE